MKKELLFLIMILIITVSYGQNKAFKIYTYNYPDYPDIEKVGSIKSVEDYEYPITGKKFNFKLLSKNNIVQNTFYYDIKNNIKKTYKVAIEVNWNYVEEFNIIIDMDFQRDNISLMAKGGTSEIPHYLLNSEDSITTHFLYNRLYYYFKLNIDSTRSDLDEQRKEKLLLQTMENLLYNKIQIRIQVKFKGRDKLEVFELVPRNSGFSPQFQRRVDLSLTYTNDKMIGNVFLTVPFRIRAKRPSTSALDFRWVGDVISFGPTIVVENSSSQPLGVGGFVGLGLSENGQMIVGVTGGYLFEPKTEFIGISYNAIGFVDGLIDLFNGKPAWKK